MSSFVICDLWPCILRSTVVFLHCTRSDKWQRCSAPMQWGVVRRSTCPRKPRVFTRTAMFCTRTGHTCCRDAYACHPPPEQQSSAWRKMNTGRWRSGWQPECLSSEIEQRQKTYWVSQKSSAICFLPFYRKWLGLLINKLHIYSICTSTFLGEI